MIAGPLARPLGRPMGRALTLNKGGGGKPSNNLFALAGDSRAYADYDGSDASITYHKVTGIGWWLQSVHTQQAVEFRREHAFAVGGSTSEHFRDTQAPLIAASSAANVLLLSSINDQAAYNWPASRSIDALSAGIDALIAAGKWLYVVAELPRGSAAFTGQRFTEQQQIDHDLVRDYLLGLSHPRITVIDAYPVVSDVGGVETDFINSATYDGVHQSSNGAYLIAGAASPVIASRFPADDFVYSASDLYNAVSNPAGNLVANSEMAGTTGTLGTNVTGQLATGYISETLNFTGLAAECTKVVRDDGEWQQVRVTGNSGAGTTLLGIRRNITFANVTTGDELELRYGEFEVDAGAVGLNAPQAGVSSLMSGSARQSSRSGANASGPWPSEAVAGRWRSMKPITMTGDENTVQFGIQLYIAQNTTGVDFTVRFRRPVLRKVIA